ncbi:Type IV secretory system Conjugative DNA transfer [Streptomyces sp. ADI92-24]|uniref:type IV secretory system conjugative DNA transfer family protein n=1 Tax=Streptomyces sp. ADI92-24 TaxID=1522756 RepID=UPI000FB97313|nr:type IV secretory system conjugative DNA transfer family protein [Streptomyces sp. ADI92-24]RPK32395.1 Type IV secretory system Conjugative DNA transfer [Streptomyces sp. ADI92-24]
MASDKSMDDGALLAAIGAGFVVGSSAIVLAAAPLAGLVSGRGWSTSERSVPETVLLSVTKGPGAVYNPAPPTWTFWLVIALFLTLLITAVAFLLRGFGGKKSHLGGAKWGGKATERKMTVSEEPEERPDRITAGRGQLTKKIVAVTERSASAIAFGPPGSAKTTGLLLGNVAEWQGPVVCTTTKAADLEAIYNSRSLLGPVHVIAPAGLPGGRASAHWSAVDYAHDADTAELMAEWMADAAQKHYDPRAEPWIAQARAILAGLLLAANISKGGIRAFREWLALGKDAVDHVRAILEPEHPEVALDYAQPWLKLHEDGAGSVQFTLNVIASVYRNNNVREVSKKTDFTAEQLLDENGTLVLVASPSNAERFAPLFTSIIASVIHAAEARFEQNGKPPERTLGCFIDEAGNVLRYPKLPTILTTGRGIGIAMLTIWHDLSQLTARVGREGAGTVISASTLRMLLPGLADPDTLKYFNYLYGKQEVERTTRSNSGGRNSTSTQPTDKDLLPVHELQQIENFTAIAQYFNLRPIRTNMRLTWRDKDLLAWLERPGPLVSLDKALDDPVLEAHHG